MQYALLCAPRRRAVSVSSLASRCACHLHLQSHNCDVWHVPFHLTCTQAGALWGSVPPAPSMRTDSPIMWHRSAHVARCHPDQAWCLQRSHEMQQTPSSKNWTSNQFSQHKACRPPSSSQHSSSNSSSSFLIQLHRARHQGGSRALPRRRKSWWTECELLHAAVEAGRRSVACMMYIFKFAVSALDHPHGLAACSPSSSAIALMTCDTLCARHFMCTRLKRILLCAGTPVVNGLLLFPLFWYLKVCLVSPSKHTTAYGL